VKRRGSPNGASRALRPWQAAALASVLAGCAPILPPARPAPDVSLQARVDRYGGEVSRLRALEIRKPVPAAIQTQDELRQALRDQLVKNWGELEVGTERAYKLFGLIPRQMDLREYLIEFYTGQVAGYYDTETERFFIRSGFALDSTTEPGTRAETASEEDAFVIAHEFAHALQDQHFDLDALDDAAKGRGDQVVALQALTEGDAILAGLDHLIWRQGLPVSTASPLARLLLGASLQAAEALPTGDDPTSQQLRDAPEVIAINALFPYVQGAAFATAVRRELGQAGIDAAFRNLPESSEQIIYPERYLDRPDRPVTIELPEPPAGGKTSLAQTLGMLDLRIMLGQYLGTQRAAEGWDGDRFAVWSIGDEEILVWVTVWDDELSARRFEGSYQRLLESKHGDDRFQVLRRGDVVTTVEGTSAERALELAQRLHGSKLTRAPDDVPPPSFGQRLLRYPLEVARLRHVTQVNVLGGNVLSVRVHGGGHLVSVARGFALRTERTPDRGTHSLLGVLWAGSDRMHDYQGFSIPLLLGYQRRAERSQLNIGSVPFLPALLSVTANGAERGFAVLGFGKNVAKSGPPSTPAP